MNSFTSMDCPETTPTPVTDLPAAPAETDQQALTRLARLTPLEYDRVRQAEAQRLGIRKETLDAQVAQARAQFNAEAQGRSVKLPPVEPWPEPVDGSQLLSQVADRFTHYVVLPTGATDALALWTAHAHAFRAFVHSPRLNLSAPERNCGKTTTLDVLATLVPRPLRTENLTAPVLFRLVDQHQPTLLLDEVDAYLHQAEELRGLLNAGHKRGACAYRCEGENNQVCAFNAFAPAALAGIGSLPGTLHDRSLVIRLVRAKPNELIARFDECHIELETSLCRQLARWTQDHFPAIQATDPTLPSTAFNRLADNWRPLFALAQVAGGDWPSRALSAFLHLTANDDPDAQGAGVMLLADIRHIFDQSRQPALFSSQLVDALCVLSDRPWREAHQGRKPITETWLARRLRSFGIASHPLRLGEDRARGYDCTDFQEAFARFLPNGQLPAGPQSAPSPDSAGPILALQA